MNYCKRCAENKLQGWRGWPLRDVLPNLLNISQSDFCPVCGCSEFLTGKKIWWGSVNSVHSTGLPDYWILHTRESGKFWGYPYLKEAHCPTCSTVGVVSHINYPDGTRGHMFNCANCGLVSLQGDALN
jgi:hypothetical protein